MKLIQFLIAMTVIYFVGCVLSAASEIASLRMAGEPAGQYVMACVVYIVATACCAWLSYKVSKKDAKQ